MPRLPEKIRRERSGRSLLESIVRLKFRTMFKRSKAGNLWRRYEDLVLSVFKRDDGSYAWCIAKDDSPEYSSVGFDTEGDALEALTDELFVTDGETFLEESRE